MSRLHPSRLLVALVCAVFLLAGADGCSSDPDVEGAKLYVNQEEYDLALENLNRALETNPDNAEAHALKARVLYLQSENMRDPAERRVLLADMVTSLDRAMALDPANTEIAVYRTAAWGNEINKGVALFQQSGGDDSALDNAIQTFDNAIYVESDSSAGHFYLGLAYLAKGEADTAIEPLERAVSIGTADAEAYRYLGRALLATDQGSRAVEVLEEGQTMHPDDEAIRAELLNAYAITGQQDRAVEAYQEMLANDPDNALLLYNYGSTLLQLKRYDEAITNLTQAVELDGSNANAQYNLGAAYQNQGFDINQRLTDETLTDAEANRLREERDALFEQAVPYLVEARSLTEASGEDAADICQALFQVYTPLGRLDDAREAGECAGMNMD
ncbi:MAG: tetratricopeptide repeat protein [Rhodothermaceae bacterium]|nr:tetratricopeptide repeat protein [Rhodothermaceae bacterium]